MDSTVVFPWGEWIAHLANVAMIVAAALVSYGVSLLPGPARMAIKGLHLDKTIDDAIDYGISSVVGAVEHKELDVHVANAVLKEALAFLDAMADAGVGFIAKAGEKERDAIRKKVAARMNVEGDARYIPTTGFFHKDA